MSVAKTLLLMWVALPILLGWALVARGSSHDLRILAAAGGVYVLDSLVLAATLARPSKRAVLDAFLDTRTARVSLWGLLFGVMGLCLGTTVVVGLGALLLVATLSLAAWTFSQSSESLVRLNQRMVLLAFSCAVAACLGELLLRIPALARATEPPAHRIQSAWARDRYDDRSFVPFQGGSFRSDHLDEPKPRGSKRIVVLGDSFSWGERIASTDDIWPYVMEAELRKRGIDTQVINLAQRGYTTVNELESLQRYGWGLSPDIVVLQYLINDPLPSGPGFENAGGQWLRAETLHLALSYSLHRWLYPRSYLYSLLDQRVTDAQIALFDLKDLSYFDLHVDGAEAWKATQAAIRTIGEECREREVSLLFVMFPYFSKGSSLDASYPYRKLHAKLRATVEGMGISYFDLLTSFAAVNVDADFWHVEPPDSHPGVLGHRVAGVAIARELIDVARLDAAVRAEQ